MIRVETACFFKNLLSNKKLPNFYLRHNQGTLHESKKDNNKISIPILLKSSACSYKISSHSHICSRWNWIIVFNYAAFRAAMIFISALLSAFWKLIVRCQSTRSDTNGYCCINNCKFWRQERNVYKQRTF